MLSYPDTLVSNNINAFGIIRALDIQGNRSVQTLNDLFTLTDPQLSLSGTNANNDALGAQWYVISEKVRYELVDWTKRKTIAGWKKAVGNTYSKEELDKKFSDLSSSMQWKPAVDNFAAIATIYPTPSEGWTVSTKDDNNIYRYDAGTSKWINILQNQTALASTTSNGLMSKEHWNKLQNLTQYVHPATHPATMITEDSTHRFFTDAERTKLAGLSQYVHPATHPATMITEDSTHRFFTDAERTKLQSLSNFSMPDNLNPNIITQDATHRFVTDTEKNRWNSTVAFPGYVGTGSIFGTKLTVARSDHDHENLSNIKTLGLIANASNQFISKVKFADNSELPITFEKLNSFKYGTSGFTTDTLFLGENQVFKRLSTNNFNINESLSLDTAAGLKITNTGISKVIQDFNVTSQKIFDKQISFEGHTHSVNDFTDWTTSKINWNRIENAPDFLQKSGGTMSGDIILPIIPGANKSAIFGGKVQLNGNSIENTVRQLKSFLGNVETVNGSKVVKNSIISVRHSNGDPSAGFYLRCPNEVLDENTDIYWKTQFADHWTQNERKLWDSFNLTKLSQLLNDVGYLTTNKKLETLLEEEILPSLENITDNTEFIVSKNGSFSQSNYKPVSKSAEIIFDYFNDKLGTPWKRKITVINDLMQIVNKQIIINRDNNENLFLFDLTTERNSYSNRIFGFYFEPELLNSGKAIEFTGIINTHDNNDFKITFWNHIKIIGTTEFNFKANSHYLLKFFSMNNVKQEDNVRFGYILIQPLFVENNENTYKSNYQLQKDIEKKESKIDYISHVSDTNKEQLVTIRPHQYHKYGELTKLIIVDDGNNPTDTLVEFMFCFETGSTPFTLVLPSTVKKPTKLEFIPNHTYQMSIIDNILQYGALAVR